MAEPPIIALRGVSLGYGANPLFEDVELQLLPGERATLVGRNGCGKTTIQSRPGTGGVAAVSKRDALPQ